MPFAACPSAIPVNACVGVRAPLCVTGDGGESRSGRGAAKSRGRAGGGGDQGRDARARAKVSRRRAGGAAGAPTGRFGTGVVATELTPIGWTH